MPALSSRSSATRPRSCRSTPWSRPQHTRVRVLVQDFSGVPAISTSRGQAAGLAVSPRGRRSATRTGRRQCHLRDHEPALAQEVATAGGLDLRTRARARRVALGHNGQYSEGEYPPTAARGSRASLTLGPSAAAAVFSNCCSSTAPGTTAYPRGSRAGGPRPLGPARWGRSGGKRWREGNVIDLAARSS
jgi:hypothetical protein